MVDREHKEWLEDRDARRVAAKKSTKKPVVRPKRGQGDRRRSGGGTDDQNDRIWLGGAA